MTELYMGIEEAVMWIKPETSATLISKAKECGMRQEDINRTIDQAIRIVCDIAEKVADDTYYDVVLEADGISFPHYLCKDKTHDNLSRETLNWMKSIIRSCRMTNNGKTIE